jgi:Ca-activated chloride channel family protein
MGLELKYPIMLLVLVPAGYLIYLYFRQIRRSRLIEKTAVGIIRAMIFILLIFALTIPQIIMPTKKETIIFLADRSASVTDAENSMIDWLNQSIAKKKSFQSYAVAGFADSTLLERTMTDLKNPLQSFNSPVNQSETNLGAAIQFASSLFPAGQGGRVVLLTDGNETQGNALEAAALLKNRKLELDYVPLKQTFKEDMALTKLDIPPSLYEGEKADISVTIASNADKQADIRISLNNQDIIHQKVNVKEGQNEFAFTYPAADPGLSVYKAEIAPAGEDAFIENNTLYASSTVKGTPRVLIVQGKQTDSLAGILTASGLLVDSIVPEKLPTALAGYLQYQSIIFNNVPATSVTGKQMNLIEKAVKEFGTGFIMLGGEDSFGLGGYFKTPIEKLLPVNMDIKGKKELPSLGLVIVVDRSGSMAGTKLELAKEAAARSAELLRDKDTLGFIAFDDRPWVIVKTAPMKNKQKVIDKIRSVTVGGGTNIYPSLELAYHQLQDLQLQQKHIILLTDGQSAAGGDYDSLIAAGKEKKITLSTVALGSDADRNLLNSLAEKGGGRFYDVTDASVIPSILSRETVMTTRTYIEDHPFYPVVQSYPGWTPLFKDGVPKMNAYIAVTPKQAAKTPIISSKKDPILAQWQYGLGTTFAFTSDVTGKWSGDWARWKNWPQFLNSMVAKSLPSFDSESFRFSLGKEDGGSVLHLQEADGEYHPLNISIVSQEGAVIDTNSKLTAPGEYDVRFPSKPGMYFLRVAQTEKSGQAKVFQSGFSVPYSEEYLLKGINKPLLKELANLTGGKELSSPQAAFRPLTDKARQQEPILKELLLAAFFLLIMEIFLRRLGFRPFIFVKQKFMAERKTAETNHTENLRQMTKAKEKANDGRKRNLQRNDELVIKKESQHQRHPVEKQVVTKEEREERLKRLLDAKKRNQQ